jgi:hypothetical protein
LPNESNWFVWGLKQLIALGQGSWKNNKMKLMPGHRLAKGHYTRVLLEDRLDRAPGFQLPGQLNGVIIEPHNETDVFC